jgi:hypothetical protein
MPFIDPTQTITITRGDGLVIANGSASAVFRHVKDSAINRQEAAAMTAEAAIAEANAKARLREIEARADALDQREAEIEAREQKAFSDQIRAFADGVTEIGRRLDALERARNEAELARLPDPDACLTDNLPPASLEPSANKDREMLQAMEAKDGERELPQSEDVLEKDDALELPDDGDPGQALPSSPILTEPFLGNELPEGTVFPVKSDGFVCARDRKAARKRMQTNGVRR